MKDQLTLEDLAPYLPHKVKFFINMTDINPNVQKEERVFTLTPSNLSICLEHGTLYLRKLSDLTKEIEVNGERFVPIERIQLLAPSSSHDIRMITFEELSGQWMLNTNRDGEVSINVMRRIDKMLYKWHFDVGDYIGRGLVIDKNTIQDLKTK